MISAKESAQNNGTKAAAATTKPTQVAHSPSDKIHQLVENSSEVVLQRQLQQLANNSTGSNLQAALIQKAGNEGEGRFINEGCLVLK